jgi:putative proteasome-type protease
MTYCVGMLTEAGLVMMADTRTNAGVDNISSFKKLHMLADGADRLIMMASAGSLSVTQTMISLLKEGIPDPKSGEKRFVNEAGSLFRAAQIVGDAVALARASVEAHLKHSGINGDVSMLLGGRVGGESLGLYMIYSEGNFIACQPDSPFLQIGEHKYGKPILDRALRWDTPIDEAVKVGLISYDSTIRSNLSVGRPIDITVMYSDATKPNVHKRITEDDAYFNALSATWGRLMIDARDKVDDPPFL